MQNIIDAIAEFLRGLAAPPAPRPIPVRVPARGRDRRQGQRR